MVLDLAQDQLQVMELDQVQEVELGLDMDPVQVLVIHQVVAMELASHQDQEHHNQVQVIQVNLAQV
jgi:hypothetical protein